MDLSAEPIEEIQAVSALDEPIRLNLGAGDAAISGYDNSWDIREGKKVYPLEMADRSVDEIRASHILEHFSHTTTHVVLSDWVRALKPGGLCKLAVPDFEYVARAYMEGRECNVQGYISGGHTDEYDVHLAQFDHAGLARVMRECGLVGIHKWKGHDDCSSLPVSLNLAGWKRPERMPKVSAVMSTPRLGFMDNFGSIMEGLMPLGIKMRRFTGAFWGQCLTRAMESVIEEEDPEWILTIDYDSIFTRETIEDLIAFATKFPDVDALCPIQMHRIVPTLLMRQKDAELGPRPMTRPEMDETLMELLTGHFGCTLIRVDALKRLRKPWFWGTPDKSNSWGDERVDEDIRFWNLFQQAGLKLFQANRVCIGHAELKVIWPSKDLEPVYQHPSDFWKDGPLASVWK